MTYENLKQFRTLEERHEDEVWQAHQDGWCTVFSYCPWCEREFEAPAQTEEAEEWLNTSP